MKKTLLILTSIVGLSACSLFPDPYKTPVAQGNVLKKSDVEQLKIGMNEAQVKYLLGTPMIIDTLTPNQWRYIFRATYADANTKISDIDNLVLIFEKGLLADIRQTD
jgi:outer membrane protein assembly factor BamE